MRTVSGRKTRFFLHADVIRVRTVLTYGNCSRAVQNTAPWHACRPFRSRFFSSLLSRQTRRRGRTGAGDGVLRIHSRADVNAVVIVGRYTGEIGRTVEGMELDRDGWTARLSVLWLSTTPDHLHLTRFDRRRYDVKTRTLRGILQSPRRRAAISYLGRAGFDRPWPYSFPGNARSKQTGGKKNKPRVGRERKRTTAGTF